MCSSTQWLHQSWRCAQPKALIFEGHTDMDRGADRK
jgi:hypothetical protein